MIPMFEGSWHSHLDSPFYFYTGTFLYESYTQIHTHGHTSFLKHVTICSDGTVRGELHFILVCMCLWCMWYMCAHVLMCVLLYMCGICVMNLFVYVTYMCKWSTYTHV